AECHVHLDTFVRQPTRSFQSLASQRTFNDDVGSDLRVVTPFAEHAFRVRTGDFCRDGTLYYLANRGYMLPEINVTFLCDQGRVCRHTIGKTEGCSFTDFTETSCVKKEFHKNPRFS